MGNDMYARGVEDTLLLAPEEARIVWEETKDGEKVNEKLRELYGMVLDKKQSLIRGLCINPYPTSYLP
ncbi:MAG TPA: hypothetical protein ENG05_01720 [Acidilobales archaeon]|nr:hypothetical protein [Acidilobales archaeon]